MCFPAFWNIWHHITLSEYTFLYMYVLFTTLAESVSVYAYLLLSIILCIHCKERYILRMCVFFVFLDVVFHGNQHLKQKITLFYK